MGKTSKHYGKSARMQKRMGEVFPTKPAKKKAPAKKAPR